MDIIYFENKLLNFLYTEHFIQIILNAHDISSREGMTLSILQMREIGFESLNPFLKDGSQERSRTRAPEQVWPQILGSDHCCNTTQLFNLPGQKITSLETVCNFHLMSPPARIVALWLALYANWLN